MSKFLNDLKKEVLGDINDATKEQVANEARMIMRNIVMTTKSINNNTAHLVKLKKTLNELAPPELIKISILD